MIVCLKFSKLIFTASNDDQSSECYDLIVKQNVKIEKFFNFLTIYMKFAAFGYCLPSIMITYWRYFTNDGTSPVIFILPMEQEFEREKKIIRTIF